MAPPNRPLIDLFADQVLRDPERPAIRFQGATLSFAQLDGWSDAVARGLLAAGVGQGHLVGLCVERSPHVMAALLGLLKVGAPYVAVDPEVPLRRRIHVLADAKPDALLGASSLLAQLETDIARIELPESNGAVAGQASWASAPDEALFHLVYTSGTSGRPKGVRVLHRGVRSRLEWMWSAFPFAPGSVICVQKSYALVASPWELLGGLLQGVPSVLLTREEVLDPVQLYENISREAITHLFLNPFLIESILAEHERRKRKLALRLVTSGADVLTVGLARRFHASFPDATLLNLYGMTECSSNVAAFDTGALAPEALRVPVGRPICGAIIRVVDAANRPLPVGSQGQIVISGPGVAQGYHEDAELTARSFRRDRDGAIWYQTGDYGRWTRSGDLELVGRLDNQVQIRGFRVELEEVELALRSSPGVTDAGVTLIQRNDEMTLEAFVCGSSVDTTSLRPALLERLPEFMVPTRFVLVEALPIGSGGKLDRARLAGLLQSFEPAPAGGPVNLSPTEQRVAKLWQELLGAPPANAGADFFNAGGHSLLAVRLISKMRAEFKRPVPLAVIFQNATLRGLAAAMELSDRKEPSGGEALTPREGGRRLPLSFAQERLWFLEQLGLVGTAYNVPLLLSLEGATDLSALERSLSEIVRRHESLRTRFEALDGSPVQVVGPATPLPLRLVDLGTLSQEQRALRFEELISEEARRPFDLTAGQPVRASLFRLASNEYKLLLTMHHIVSDGWSLGVLNRELEALYTAFSQGRPSPLRDPPIQYADYAIWQRKHLQGAGLEESLRYWSTRLHGAPSDLQLPTDRPRPRVLTFNGATLAFELPPGLFEKVDSLARQDGATWFMAFLAAFKILLARYSGQNDVVVGSPTAGRAEQQTEDLIGFFLNMLVFRTDLSGDPTYRQLLGRVKEVTLGAYAHQDLPFEKLVKELRPERNLTQQPLFQVAIAQNFPEETASVKDLRWSWRLAEHGAALFDLTLYLTDSPDGMRMSIEYSTDLFERSTVARMATHLRALLEQIVAEPDRAISQLQLGDETERALIQQWNSTEMRLPDAADVTLVLEQAALSRPDAIAVHAVGQTLTYRELHSRANELALVLRDRGVRAADQVGVLISEGPELPIAFYALLRLGAIYLPLEATSPLERLKGICRDAGVHWVLARRNAPPVLDGLDLTAIEVDGADLLADRDRAPGELPPLMSLDAPAYTIYTSGSTGMPKGVLVHRRALANVVAAQRRTFALSATDRVMQLSAISFDVSIFDFLLALGAQACLVLGSREERLPGRSLTEFLRSQCVSAVAITPTGLSMLMPERLPSVRTLIVAGEEFPPALASAWLPGRSVFNAYGPTETAIFVSTYKCCAEGIAARVPIGVPIDNVRMHVLRAGLHPAAIGEVGELCIAGTAVALGYLHRAALTAERFIDLPFERGKVYRTGDMVRWQADGNLGFVGRDDGQVKIRGQRLELGEIEAVLREHPAVDQAVAVAYEDPSGERRIAAYVVCDREVYCAPGGGAESVALRSELLQGWQALYEDTYGGSGEAVGPNFTGWTSSYDGKPIPDTDMEEWRAAAVQRIRELRPNRVLEIGCGVGLLLEKLAPECTEYVGTDFSAAAVDQLTRWACGRPGLRHVQLLRGSATELEDLPASRYDTIILNSVVQYFPDIEYLLAVIAKALRLLAPGGNIFLGDIRHFGLLLTLHSAVQLFKAPPTVSVGELRGRIARAVAHEKELTVEPLFFHSLVSHFQALTAVDIQLKRGRASNELTRYRYDVVLQTGELTEPVYDRVNWSVAGKSYEQFEAALAERRWGSLLMTDIPNLRLAEERAALQLIEESDKRADVGTLRRRLQLLKADGYDPGRLWELGEKHGYDARLLWTESSLPGCFDIKLFNRDRENVAHPVSVSPGAMKEPASRFANDPLQSALEGHLVAQLRPFLQARIPEYMIPSAWMILSELPLTPSGKLDRSALPPLDVRAEEARRYVAPQTRVERSLAQIWADVLNVDRVGVCDNFFELGGHSLLAAKLIGRISEYYGIPLNTRSLFESPTVRHIAQLIDKQILVQRRVVDPSEMEFEQGTI